MLMMVPVGRRTQNVIRVEDVVDQIQLVQSLRSQLRAANEYVALMLEVDDVRQLGP